MDTRRNARLFFNRNFFNYLERCLINLYLLSSYRWIFLRRFRNHGNSTANTIQQYPRTSAVCSVIDHRERINNALPRVLFNEMVTISWPRELSVSTYGHGGPLYFSPRGRITFNRNENRAHESATTKQTTDTPRFYSMSIKINRAPLLLAFSPSRSCPFFSLRTIKIDENRAVRSRGTRTKDKKIIWRWSTNAIDFWIHRF